MISNIDQRILKYKASDTSWTDLTIAVNDFQSSNAADLIMLPGDYLYISAFLPFNHKYFKLSTPSTDDVPPLIEVCGGRDTWSPVVDVLDYTLNMSTSGVIQWTPDSDKTWGRISRNRTDIDAMDGAPTIYDAYWLRISWPSAPSTFSLEYVGQLFSMDADLYAEYPVLQNMTIMQGWKAGKTSWIDQHILAASYITKELIQRQIMLNDAQVLDIATLKSPAVHKAAHIIYSGLGAKNYEKEIVLSASNFEQAMRKDKFQVDTDGDARKGINDMRATSSRATR